MIPIINDVREINYEECRFVAHHTAIRMRGKLIDFSIGDVDLIAGTATVYTMVLNRNGRKILSRQRVRVRRETKSGFPLKRAKALDAIKLKEADQIVELYSPRHETRALRRLHQLRGAGFTVALDQGRENQSILRIQRGANQDLEKIPPRP